MATFRVLWNRKTNMTGDKIFQGFAVKLSAGADGEIELCDADTDVLYGVALEDIRNEDAGDIGVIGRYPCRAGDAVAPGQRVGPNADGKFVPVTRDGKTVAGVAEESAELDELFEVTLGVGITLSMPAPAMIRKPKRRR